MFALLLVGMVIADPMNQNQNQNNNTDDSQNQEREQERERECFLEGQSLGQVTQDNTNECCEGLYAHTRLLGDKGICRKMKETNRTEFTPYQKRNESECLDGCKCVGAVVSCPTENGKIMTIEAGRSGNTITIIVNKTQVESPLNLSLEDGNRTRLKIRLQNGTEREIKIMPDVASQRALERLKLKVCNESNNCTIQLKQVREKNQEKLKYLVQAYKEKRFLFWKWKSRVQTQIDAETGEVA